MLQLKTEICYNLKPKTTHLSFTKVVFCDRIILRGKTEKKEVKL